MNMSYKEANRILDQSASRNFQSYVWNCLKELMPCPPGFKGDRVCGCCRWWFRLSPNELLADPPGYCHGGPPRSSHVEPTWPIEWPVTKSDEFCRVWKWRVPEPKGDERDCENCIHTTRPSPPDFHRGCGCKTSPHYILKDLRHELPEVVCEHWCWVRADVWPEPRHATWEAAREGQDV